MLDVRGFNDMPRMTKKSWLALIAAIGEAVEVPMGKRMATNGFAAGGIR
jgi:hypothetical protein